MSFLLLTEAITTAGAFFLYAGIAFLSIFFVLVFMPETKGKTLEEIQSLFVRGRSSSPPPTESGDGDGTTPATRKHNGSSH